MKFAALAIFALIASKLTSFAGVDTGMISSGTPYDRYMTPVKQTLSTLGKSQPSMEQVQSLMKVGRSFRYHMDDPYVAALPHVTAQTRTGDCKDKALWLCDMMNDASVRFVIGKTHKNAKISHAWVVWQNEGRHWILDCTLKSAPIAADTLPSDKYIPLYSYGKGAAYRHGLTAVNVATVAAKKAPARVASKK